VGYCRERGWKKCQIDRNSQKRLKEEGQKNMIENTSNETGKRDKPK